jgi:hypothetical protein
VRNYLAAVARPFSSNALRSWEDAETIADGIYADAFKPDGDVANVWLDFTEILLDLAGPLTGDTTSVIASLMELGAWAFASDRDGKPTGADLKIKADAVAATLSGQMQDAREDLLEHGQRDRQRSGQAQRRRPQRLLQPGAGMPASVVLHPGSAEPGIG